MTADALSPDAVLVVSCMVARAAVEAYQAAAHRDEPGDVMAALFDRERLAVECVSATKARSPAGVAAKAALLEAYWMATNASEPSPEIVALAVSLAEDALALVKSMMGEGCAPE